MCGSWVVGCHILRDGCCLLCRCQSVIGYSRSPHRRLPRLVHRLLPTRSYHSYRINHMTNRRDPYNLFPFTILRLFMTIFRRERFKWTLFLRVNSHTISLLFNRSPTSHDRFIYHPMFPSSNVFAITILSTSARDDQRINHAKRSQSAQTLPQVIRQRPNGTTRYVQRPITGLCRIQMKALQGHRWTVTYRHPFLRTIRRVRRVYSRPKIDHQAYSHVHFLHLLILSDRFRVLHRIPFHPFVHLT